MGRSAQPTQTHVNPTPPALQPMQQMMAAAMQQRMMHPSQAAPGLPAGMDIFQQLYGQSMPTGAPIQPQGTAPRGPMAPPTGRPYGPMMPPPQVMPPNMQMSPPAGAPMVGLEGLPMTPPSQLFQLPQMGGRPLGPFTPPDLMRPMVSGSRFMQAFGQPYAPRKGR